jgi:hypothetical protein
MRAVIRNHQIAGFMDVYIDDRGLYRFRFCSPSGRLHPGNPREFYNENQLDDEAKARLYSCFPRGVLPVRRVESGHE